MPAVELTEPLTPAQIECIAAYATNNMNIQATATSLYRHRNAVEYHLREVKRKTGLDPKVFFNLIRLLNLIEEKEAKHVQPKTVPPD